MRPAGSWHHDRLKLWRSIAREFDLTWRAPALVLGAAVLIAGFFIAKCVHDRRRTLSAGGELLYARAGKLGDGRAVALLGVRVSMGDEPDVQRLELVDLRDGNTIARERVDSITYCVPVGARAWCGRNLVSGSQLHVRDLATLKTVIAHDKLVATAPRLAENDSVAIDGASGEAWMNTADGRYWHVDSNGSPGAVADAQPRGFATLARSDHWTLTQAHTAFGELRVDGHPRGHLVARDGAALPGFEGIDPEIVVREPNVDMALEVDGRVAIVHADTVDSGSPRSLTVFAPKRASWTQALDARDVRGAWVVGDTLVVAVATAAAPSALLAFDLLDGHLHWRHN